VKNSPLLAIDEDDDDPRVAKKAVAKMIKLDKGLLLLFLVLLSNIIILLRNTVIFCPKNDSKHLQLSIVLVATLLRPAMKKI